MTRTWRDLPGRYGPHATAYNRFNRWTRRGHWTCMFEVLAATSRDSLYLIDSTIAKAHRAASDAKGEEKSGNRRQPWRPFDQGPGGRRRQGPPAGLHADGRSGPRQSVRGRRSRYVEAGARSLRQARTKLPCRRKPGRRTLLDQFVSPDPSWTGVATLGAVR